MQRTSVRGLFHTQTHRRAPLYTHKRMKILKFGGTSVGSPEAIRQLIDILKDNYATGQQFTVVFSAFSKVTDALLGMAKSASLGSLDWRETLVALHERHNAAIESLIKPGAYKAQAQQDISSNFESLADVLQGIFLVQEVSPRSLDLVGSFGERNSAAIIALAMADAGIPTDFCDARRLIRTDDHFTAAKVDMNETFQLIKDHYTRHPKVQAVTGFVGSTEAGLTTTLGRGGSDYTAAIIGAALHAECIEIWTDVDGVLSADPRKVKKAFTQKEMTYREAMEMSHFGAKVIYPPTIQPAMARNIPLVIRNTFHPEFLGTWITHEVKPSEQAIKGISSISQITMITLQGGGLFGIPGIAARLFKSLGEANVNVALITQSSSEYSITFAVAPEAAFKAKIAAEKEFMYELREGALDQLKIEEKLSVIAVVGENMRYRPGIAGAIFQALGANGINISAIAQGSSELNVSIVVPAADETKAINAIHDAFFLSDARTVHVFMVGVGLIGGTLLKQIAAQHAFLLNKRKIDIKVVGLANSRKMVFAEGGIPLDNWAEVLNGSEHVFSMHTFTRQMIDLNLPNAIFIDNTASASLPDFYEQILDESISISTANKVAASGPLMQYKRLKRLARKRNVQWRYETNVGAGLPVINTLNDLIQSGDRLHTIEGVLSGTLSFLFNHFRAGVSFSALLREALVAGYTEPDPRDDLSGADVRRKLLILAREAGHELESEDIKIEPLLPQSCIEAVGVEAFFEDLTRYDQQFEERRAAAEAEGKVLRFIATLDDTGARIALRAVEKTHPFASLDGSDNMIVFFTERYHTRPLVVRGPGAGAEVTAAGVFAEVIGMMG
jgi:bifunctional aspartokinase / homoserine dehydrogenase 1